MEKDIQQIEIERVALLVNALYDRETGVLTVSKGDTPIFRKTLQRDEWNSIQIGDVLYDIHLYDKSLTLYPLIVDMANGKGFMTVDTAHFANIKLEVLGEDETQQTFYFRMGNVEVKTNNINELREYVEEIKPQEGEDLSKYLSDFIFDVEVAYQKYHGLDEDDYSMIEREN